jgi:hypothetical protein
MTEVLGSRAILAPVVALVAWTLVMMLWLYATRLPAIRRNPALMLKPGLRGADMEGAVEPRVQWPSHNYTHLMEQPTLFYAVAITLALLGAGGGLSLTLAWLYVALRVAHSLVQATVNIIPLRFLLFSLASLCLIGLTVQAACVLIQAQPI